MTRKVTLSRLSASPNQTIWRADFAGVPGKSQGATYRVTTYPNSDSIYLETWVKGRQVSQNVASRITADIRAALEASGAFAIPSPSIKPTAQRGAPAARTPDALDAERWRRLEQALDAGRISIVVEDTVAEKWDSGRLTDAGQAQDWADAQKQSE